LALAACASRPLVFEPLPVTSAPNGHDVVVQVRPLDTRMGGEDRRRYGVDLGAYYSAFVVSVDNRASHALTVDLSSSTLQEVSGRVLAVLTDEEVVRGYRSGGGHEGLEVVSKAPSVIKQEVERIRASRVLPATLPPGGRAEGVLLFSPLTGACGESVLTVQGIEVVEDGRRFVFQFPLTACAATPNVAAP
jgi:hypothetical protein